MRHSLPALLAAFVISFASSDVFAEAAIEVAAVMDEAPGNIAVSAAGRIFVSLHQAYGPSTNIVEIVDGTSVPFADDLDLVSVLGLRVDAVTGNLWLLDNARTDPDATPKLVEVDLATGKAVRTIMMDDQATDSATFHNDLAVASKHQAIFIADPNIGGQSTLVVVDLQSGEQFRRLRGQNALQPEDVPSVIAGRRLQFEMPDGSIVEPRVGINPISISPDEEWLYFGSMSGTAIYRVKVTEVLDRSLSDEGLAARIERYGDKPVSGGITVDDAGNVYITDVGAQGLGVTRADGSYELLASDADKLDWTDGLSVGPGGYVYATVNRLDTSPMMNGGINESEPPFYVVRIKALAPTTVGR